MAAAILEEMLRNDLAEMKAASDQKDPQAVIAEVQQELDLLENIKIDIAVTGMTGAGKSSLVNALLGMKDDDDGAAKTDVIETTKELKEYQYPTFPKLKIWDLPGIGTPAFKAKEYLQKVNFNKYDFFIIVASERFTENDTKLASEIKKLNKRFYYVRTKVDVNIDSESRKRDFSEKKTLEKIWKNCCENLKALGESSPRVFLISRWDLSKYDFPLLQDTIEKEQDKIKRDVLIMFMPILTKEGIKKKKAAMESLIWKRAMLSCSVGLIPIPFLSLGCDIAILASTMNHICKVFGLDEASLRRLAFRVEKPVEELKSVIENTPSTSEITTKFVTDFLQRSMVWGTVTVIELALDFVPIVGSLYGGGSSLLTTLYMLKGFLKDVVKDAENVQAKAIESKRSK
ncbi:interferon-inducible GTPase 5-like [Rhineura floridana]|uniref:interferon-inducible GTPase 5-like n=1 Tax=Rhineura floridana TaxID=261503 RepID=UPI002AC8065E|nr:interferon-inducible GTPase 5-like [Rhineura floridana]XP_061452689.1 interferon-inducible GTPase 5-like [Rhineura floridana]XP_061452690.1 interferon-inducible GTPase 5-like [Rhineura floridana]XP_061452691.1 interferon-inducible GTPase 5-like [Rhineura floridana]XP_061452692.1 interferon-inducible GTPase 5-like [Rhineura floridana]XP_061452694.1 interferon-inducible GTPase 5-like [Rhineura floridana]XP_061452695.1 interferon-inducible GTPase 5-like [Rhineura floridana]